MNPGPLLFLGTFLAMAFSWFCFVMMPQLTIGRQAEFEGYPVMRSGLARQGEQVYRANGCNYCHTEQVRPAGFGSDAGTNRSRDWGGRPGIVQSVSRDYLYDQPVMLGSQRVGPDLANIGRRQTNETMLLAHIYDPQKTMLKSVMPPYRYLFVKRTLKAGEQPSADALPGSAAGEEIVPTGEGRALAAYLLSLRSENVLYETPPPMPPPGATTNAVPGTNAVTTNRPTTNSPVR